MGGERAEEEGGKREGEEKKEGEAERFLFQDSVCQRRSQGSKERFSKYLVV
jgi:hypothetical protein